MKTLLLVFGLTASVGCSPIAQGFCETKAGCGLVDDADTCLEGLRATRDNAEMRGCGDEYYSFAECEVNVEFACDDLARALAESCSVELCEYLSCSEPGGAAQMAACADNPDDPVLFDPVGTWAMQMTPNGAGACSSEISTVGVEVTSSGGQYQLMIPGSALTGTVVASRDSAQMNARINANGGAYLMFAATATRSSAGQPVTITGSGYRYVNESCADDLRISGTIQHEAPP